MEADYLKSKEIESLREITEKQADKIEKQANKIEKQANEIEKQANDIQFLKNLHSNQT